MNPYRWLMAAVLMIGVLQATWQTKPSHAGAQGADPELLQIGVVDSLVKDLSKGRRELLATEFPELVLEFTGFKSQINQGGDPFAGAKKLATGEWHLAVYQGIEFAWAQAKNPKLLPLVLAVNREGPVHAVLVAKKDSALTGFADLKGKDVYVFDARLHVRLFAEKGAEGNAKTFFGKRLITTNAQAALDDILRGKVQAAVIDNNSLESYQEIHPGKFDRLKVLAKSEPFPAKVIAHYQGVLSDRVLDKLRAGMVKANKTAQGREFLADVGITAFEPVSADYAKLFADIVKAYPAPK